MKNNIKAAVFDFDGTLADTEPYHRAVRAAMLAERGVSGVENMFSGISLRDFWSRVAAEHALSESGEALAKLTFDRVADEIVADGIKAIDGAVGLLKALKARGVIIAIASSSDRDYVHRLLRYFGLAEHADHVICGDEVVRNKPAPDIYLKALGYCGVDACAAFAVEDSDVGMAAAQAAGLYTVGYDAPANELKQTFAHCDVRVKSLREIIDIMEKRL